MRVQDLGSTRYMPVFQAMQAFTAGRVPDTPDEIWLTEHEPVFTQGQAGRAEHLLAPGEIEVVQSDRGGQVTYHGPGQLVAYLMIDVKRAKLTPRGLVSAIENSIIELLAGYGIEAANRRDAPGVYVDGAKVASLGLRIRRGCSYHGLALNVNMDLEPFGRINPCGLIDLSVTQLADLGGPDSVDAVKRPLVDRLSERLQR
ncbi:MAG TPA: lipoyl(octanoyl) transferase LipB [Pseudomonadales bacterium]|nr:lipoyl(octanoyl) transferase LipB [Pseudomonadales bacterium]